jgi:hypothetical protein
MDLIKFFLLFFETQGENKNNVSGFMSCCLVFNCCLWGGPHILLAGSHVEASDSISNSVWTVYCGRKPTRGLTVAWGTCQRRGAGSWSLSTDPCLSHRDRGLLREHWPMPCNRMAKDCWGSHTGRIFLIEEYYFKSFLLLQYYVVKRAGASELENLGLQIGSSIYQKDLGQRTGPPWASVSSSFEWCRKQG